MNHVEIITQYNSFYTAEILNSSPTLTSLHLQASSGSKLLSIEVDAVTFFKLFISFLDNNYYCCGQLELV